ncbi:MAG: putative LPS assembly protein LptD [Paludibacter sp.]|nr:putative LPS assembly protein LptD [Paludibacter sp.]
MQTSNQLYFSNFGKFLLLISWLVLGFTSFSQDKLTTTNVQNSILSDSLINIVTDTLKNVKSDSLDLENKKKQKSNQIDAEIDYSAQDSIVLWGNGTGFLHGTGDVKYKNINLKADFVRVKMDSSLVYAKGKTDSIGTKTGEPVFSEGATEYSSKELNYNLKTKKGFIRQAVTEQGEGYIISDKTKKTAEDVLCIAGGKYTTCSNHDHPDFYLSLTKGKVKPGSYVVSGPAYLVIQDVPLPIAIPFGFFPFTDKYSSGIIMPSYQDELTRGFGLQNGGYYFAINDYVDLDLNGEIWTNGTWALNATSNYVKKYKFRGNFSVSYREDITGEKDLSDYTKASNLSIRWSHSQDQKANPNLTFSSSVNFATSGYNQSNINTYNQPEINSENTKGSSVSFSKRFPDSPFSLSGSMLINQRTKDSTISLTLPNISISMSRIYPFKRKNPIGNDRWYEKISMSYSGTMSNSIDTKENLLFKSSFSQDWKNGMRHSIPLSATFNILKYINVSPSVNYTERWYLTSINKSWDTPSQEIIVDTINGFNRVWDFNMGVSASTKLYGMYMPIRAIFGDKIDRIRHVMTPSLGFSYRPDYSDPMWGYYDTYTKSVVDATNPDVYTNQSVQYSHYEGSMYGTPSTGKSGSLNFSVGNNVEMKLRNDNDTTGTEKFKIVSLIDNLSFSGAYNLAVDTMRWSTFSTNLRIKIGKSYSLSLSGAFDPYMYGLTSSGSPVRINKLRWENGGFPRFLGTSTSYSYTLNNDTFKKLFGKKDKSNKTNESGDNPQTDTPAMTDDEYINNNPDLNHSSTSAESKKKEEKIDGYDIFSIPWRISINYSIRYSNTSEFDYDKMEYKMDFTHNLSFSGGIDLTKNWKISTSTSYDFDAKKFTYTNVNITRSLHCWNMSGSIVPFGTYKSYSFHIGVNASMLQDLKYDKQSSYGTNNISWY